jgi:hypothetical protein
MARLLFCVEVHRILLNFSVPWVVWPFPSIILADYATQRDLFWDIHSVKSARYAVDLI